MTKFLIILPVLCLLLCTPGCATCPQCPPEDAYYLVSTPFGPVPVKMRRDFFKDRDNWMTEQQYREWRDGVQEHQTRLNASK